MYMSCIYIVCTRQETIKRNIPVHVYTCTGMYHNYYDRKANEFVMDIHVHVSYTCTHTDTATCANVHVYM